MAFERFSGFFSTGDNINKIKDGNVELEQGVISDLIPELKLDIKDEELSKQAKQWQKNWQF